MSDEDAKKPERRLEATRTRQVAELTTSLILFKILLVYCTINVARIMVTISWHFQS
jgi:hypothetical protein